MQADCGAIPRRNASVQSNQPSSYRPFPQHIGGILRIIRLSTARQQVSSQPTPFFRPVGNKIIVFLAVTIVAVTIRGMPMQHSDCVPGEEIVQLTVWSSAAEALAS